MELKIPKQVRTRWAPAFGILGVMLYYALFLYRHALNIPYADDIYDVLQFLINVVKSTDFTHTLTLFFAQQNEHRTSSSRLIYYLALILQGEINFRTLIFLANLALPLLLFMLYCAIRRHRDSLLILLPVALVLFQPRFWELSFWSMAGFAYMFVYLYAFASITCLRAVGLVRFLAALIFATLGTFTLASGQLIWIVGLASLLHQSLIVRRISLAYAGCWMLCAVLVLSVWRIDYETPNTMELIWNNFLNEPQHLLTYFFVLLGNAISSSSVLLAGCTGFAVLMVVGYANVRSIARDDISLELFGGFIVLSIFALALGRAPNSNLEYALSSRYSFPSVLLLATTVTWLAYHLPVSCKKLRVYPIIILLATAYSVSSFQTYPVNLQKVLEKTVKYYNREAYWAFLRPIDETNSIVREAISLGIYVPPARPHPMPNVAPAAKPRHTP